VILDTIPAESTVSAAEVLSALSRALDLTEGQPLGHTVRACAIGMRLGQEVGLDEEALAALYYALLLKDAGCSSNAARMAALFGSDDQRVKPHLKVVDWDDRLRLAVETWRASGLSASLWSRVNHFLGIARQDGMTQELISARCERGADIAARLGFPDATAAAIRSLDEHWNGKGYPQGLRHGDIPILSRILNIAQTVEVFLAREGVAGALGVLRDRRGRWFDPVLADEVLSWQWDESWWSRLVSPDVEAQVVDLEPSNAPRRLGAHGVDDVAAAFAGIIDAKSPFTFQHSSNVAMYACAIGEAMGFDAETLRRTRLAALLHDVGKLGVSNRILDKNGPLDAAERGAMERHPLFTWDILSRVEAFAPFARQAATHHEKLDGSGYPWKLAGDELDMPSRVLVVADIYEAVTATRPYRGGIPAQEAIAILQQHRGTKLDPHAIDALASRVLEPVAEHLVEEL
jgi:HD-GYP domain-containing protein (c-di-GMP phosphodiesterase class II)